MRLSIILFTLAALTTGAMAGTITKEGSADLSAGTFSDTRISGDAVVLSVTAEEQWTAGGVKLNSSNTGNRGGVEIDSDGSGGVWVVWDDNRQGESYTDIYAAHVNSAGTATEKAVEVAGDKDFEQPDIVKSINGSSVDGVIIVYQHKADKGLSAVKYNAAGVSQWGATVCQMSQVPHDPRVASDRSGGAVFVWQDWSDMANGPAIIAQRLDSTGSIPGGTDWVTNGITICASTTNPASSPYPKNPLITHMKSADNDEGYIITWYDTREGYRDIYASRVEDDGGIDTGHFGANGKKISDSSIYKKERRQASSLTYNGALTIFEQGAVETSKDIVAQLTQGDGRVWLPSDAETSPGLTLNASSGYLTKGGIAALPDYEAIFSWIDMSGPTNYVQRITTYGTPEWGAGGKVLSGHAIVDLVYDLDDGAYATAVSGSPGAYIPYVQRISPTGSALWGDGVAAASYGIGEVSDFQLVASETPGVIVAWVDDRTSNQDVYAQKFEEKFASSGTYTSAKIENTASDFSGWTTMSWTEAALAGEVKTAATSTGLDSAAWDGITNSGTITSHGKWVQTRFSLTAGASGDTTPELISFTLNYSGESIVASPEISVEIGGVEILSGDYVGSSPTLDIQLTDDDNNLASFGGLTLDDNAVPYTEVSTSPAEWNLQANPTISEGTHTLALSATDSDGNTTSKSYTLKRTARSAVAGGSVKAMASGDSVKVAYELTAPARVKIIIRDIRGRKVKEVFTEANVSGGLAGYNAVDMDVRDLGIGVYLIYVAPTGGAPSVGKFSITQ